ncbi:TorF family putative porin [Rhodanobacter sp. PCA2]|uniref:TorF family putative porin n=1 Tax=Rhodanobacter sp. PCA2 TaxID=2006117 RepID=UPI0031B7FE2A
MRARVACSALLLCGVATSARADDAGRRWSGDLTLASQYVSRGFQQSWGRPALQGGLDCATPQGWFAGTWASGVSPRFVEGGRMEWDLYAGYAGSHDALDYRAALYHYRYPGARISATGTPYDYGEAILGAGWHGWSLDYSVTWTRDYFGFNSRTLGIGERMHSRGSTYLDLKRRIDLGHRYGLTLHYGWQRVNHFRDYGWRDASVALARGFGGFDATLAYARGWNGAGVYRAYSTGVADSNGRLHVSNPIAGTWYFTVGRSF